MANRILFILQNDEGMRIDDPVNLLDMLDREFSVNKTGSLFCNSIRCKQLTDHTGNLFLGKSPQFLIMGLCRYVKKGDKMIKINDSVVIPDSVDFFFM